jgi:hypothetical protein
MREVATNAHPEGARVIGRRSQRVLSTHCQPMLISIRAEARLAARRSESHRRRQESPPPTKAGPHRAQAGSRAAKPPSASEGTLDAAEHGGRIPSRWRGLKTPAPLNRERPEGRGDAARRAGSLPVQRDASMGPGCLVPSNRSRRVFQHIADHVGANASDGRGDIDPLLVGHPRSAVLVRWLTQ